MNEVQNRQPQRLSFSAYINSPTGTSLVKKAIPDVRAQKAFVTAIVAAVSANPGLQECTFDSIISAALQGTAMGLAPSPQLGQFYMVPFKDKKKGVLATFVVGYRGLIQLAMRSGQYIDLDAMPVKEGEYLGRDSLTGRPKFQFVEDDNLRESLPTIGYMAYFELKNGARKTIYWSREKMISHADKYSPAFSRNATSGKYARVSFADYEAGNYPKGDAWLYSSHWYQNFDMMAMKTMLRQLISKWGPVSIDMAAAIESDTAAEAEGIDIMPAIPAPEPVREIAPEPVREPEAAPVQGVELSLDDPAFDGD